ncbi:hypothetical protein E4T56_gene3476 [Termitomyces sp. T112]|nr:hypothetical protein E4T56_gene3476 [Termitomyces sp. T112]
MQDEIMVGGPTLVKRKEKNQEVIEDSNEEEEVIEGASNDEAEKEAMSLAEWCKVATAITKSLGGEEMEVEQESKSPIAMPVPEAPAASDPAAPWQEVLHPRK